MKIVYIARSAIPSRDANSIHAMKMCQAFADNGHEVIFLLPDRSRGCEPGVSDIYAYYGVKRN
ncbi:MAG: glycosyltransferase family 4 protein, partial [Chlorobiaceae bacterium]|nr:glycosyltransferase family 4 protein [Chlorobiaceae bacterium]